MHDTLLCMISYDPLHEKTCFMHMRETGTDQLSGYRVSCVVTVQLISAFVFASYIQNFKPLAIFFGCTARFVLDLVGNREDSFSRN